MSVAFRVNEGCEPQTHLAWDTIWNAKTGLGDWGYAGFSTSGNAGGLQAEAAIATAVELALFTDKRCPVDHPLAKFLDGDQRGWWGNSVDLRDDLGESELGSLLWLLERAPLTDEVLRWAQAEAQAALAPLIAQGVAVRVDVQAEADKARNRLNLAVALYGRDGKAVHARKFDLLWQQVA